MAAEAEPEPDLRALAPLAVRAAVGGLLMGLANLVPGISGGTMLLAAGVYPTFIHSIAEVTTLRFRLRSLVTLGAVGGAAALAILLLAGTLRSLVIEQRWVMYSLFIGLTLGGVPLVWRLARPATGPLYAGAAASFALMVVMALGLGGGERGGEPSVVLLVLSGLAGASAMILPGVSGGYLLLLLGQYETILGAIDELKEGLLGPAGLALEPIWSAAGVVVPVGVGVVIGVVGVSNALERMLDRYEKPTLGVLLGLLLGAVVGLWPFQEPVEPPLGSVVDGRVVTLENREAIDPDDWPVVRFDPGAGQVAGSLGLLLLGLGGTLLVARIGDGYADEPEPPGG